MRHIYKSPIIHHNSVIKNPNACCAKLSLKFENSGEYILDNRKNQFFKNKFSEYEIRLDNDYLYQKMFAVSQESIVETMRIKSGEVTSSSENNIYRVYPYGGFYEYGAHPQEIESCIFQVNSGNRDSAIKIWTLSTFKKKLGIDPTMNKNLENGLQFVGVQTFSPSQQMTLYEELMGGICTISISNTETKENTVYKSNGVFHVPNTDLIKINFINE